MATTIILGDIAEGQKWWGTAEFLKTQLAATYRQNNSFMHTWKQVSQDTKIFCEMRAGIPWAFIFSGSELYMESGFYDFLSAAPCNENTYKPAILHYNSPIQTYISSLDNPLQGKLNLSELAGEQLLDGMQSISVGGSALITSASDPCGNAYISETEVFATNSEKIRVQKMAQNRVPSSMYSGKMRLFIQAVYGSKRSDYYINLGINNLPVAGDYTLYMYDTQGDSFELGWGYPYTCGVYTTDDHQFYLMKTVTDEIYFYPLVPTPAGSSLRVKLVESEGNLSAQDIEKLEAYILSTCQIDTANSFIVPISGAQSIGGGPLAYGWHFSKSGHKCTIVIHEDVSAGGDLTEFEAHELTVNISETGGVFSAIMSETATGLWCWNNYFVVWVPEYYQYSQVQFGSYKYSANTNTGECPLYGWYDGETYDSININLSVINSSDAYDEGDIVAITGCGDQPLGTLSRGTANGASGTIALTGGCSKIIDIIHSSSRFAKSYYWADYGAWTGAQTASTPAGVNDCDYGGDCLDYLVGTGDWTHSGPNYTIVWHDIGDPDYLYSVAYQSRNRIVRYNYSANYNQSQTGDLGIVIPMLDSENIVCIDKTVNSCDHRTTWEGRYDNGTPYNVQMEYLQVRRMKDSPYTISVIGSNGTHNSWTSSSGGSSSGGTIVEDVYNIVEEWADMNIAVESSGSSALTEDGYVIKESSGGTGSASWADSYVSAAFGSILGSNTVTAMSSYGGATVVGHGEGTGENRNGFRHDSAVGWA